MEFPQTSPCEVEGLEEAYKELEKLSKNTRGIKIAAWVTASSTFVLAVVGTATLVFSLIY